MRFKLQGKWLMIGCILYQMQLHGALYMVDKHHHRAGDHNPGTESLPFLTIQKGISQAIPGDTVFVKPGIYKEAVTIAASGEPDRFITLIGDTSGKVVLDGTGLGEKRGVTIGAYWPKQVCAFYIRIENLEIKNFMYDGLRAVNSPKGLGPHHLILKNIHSHHNGQRGIYLFPDEVGEMDDNGYGRYVQAGCHLLENCLTEYNQYHGIKLGGTDNVVKHCISRYNNPDGIHEGTGYGLQVSGGNRSVSILGGSYHHNRDYGISIRARGKNIVSGVACYENHGSGLQVTSLAENVTIENVSCYSNAEEGIKVNDYAQSVRIKNSEVYANRWYGIRLTGIASHVSIENNRIYANQLSGIRTMKKTDITGRCHHIRIVNNAVYNNKSSGISIDHSDTIEISNNTLNQNISNTGSIFVSADVNDIRIRNNILKNLYCLDMAKVGSDYNCYFISKKEKPVFAEASWQNMNDVRFIYRQELHSIQGNPQYFNVKQNDFRLGSASPCIGTAEDGSNLGASDEVIHKTQSLR